MESSPTFGAWRGINHHTLLNMFSPLSPSLGFYNHDCLSVLGQSLNQVTLECRFVILFVLCLLWICISFLYLFYVYICVWVYMCHGVDSLLPCGRGSWTQAVRLCSKHPCCWAISLAQIYNFALNMMHYSDFSFHLLFFLIVHHSLTWISVFNTILSLLRIVCLPSQWWLCQSSPVIGVMWVFLSKWDLEVKLIVFLIEYFEHLDLYGCCHSKWMYF